MTEHDLETCLCDACYRTRWNESHWPNDSTLDSPTGALTKQISALEARGFQRVNDPRTQPADAALLRELADAMERLHHKDTVESLRSAAAMLREVTTPTLDGDECVTASMSIADKTADLLSQLSSPLDSAARLRALAVEMDHRPHQRWVRVADQLMAELSAEWSAPVRVKITNDDGRELQLVFKRELQ